jgi:hypothetical protein
LFAIKKPNILVTWNLDTGGIIKNTILKGLNYDKFKKHSEWNGQALLKQSKEAKIVTQPAGTAEQSLFASSTVKEEEKTATGDKHEKENSQHIYALVEIKSDTEVIEHCRFMYDHNIGMRLYASYPYLLVMDENSTKMFTLEGNQEYKTLK